MFKKSLDHEFQVELELELFSLQLLDQPFQLSQPLQNQLWNEAESSQGKKYPCYNQLK